MALETNCTLERDRRKIAGRALLEPDQIAFRGRTQRITLSLSEVSRMEIQGDALVLEYGTGPVLLHLASGMATTWLARIRNPRSLLGKLGVKAGMTVVVLGVTDEDFLQQLARRVGSYATTLATPSDIIVLGAESQEELARLPALREALAPNGAIWVVHPKGREASLRDVDVIAAGRRSGLVDTRVVAFSATHAAQRLVIPRSDR